MNILQTIGNLFVAVYSDEAAIEAGGGVPVKLQVASIGGKPAGVVGVAMDLSDPAKIAAVQAAALAALGGPAHS